MKPEPIKQIMNSKSRVENLATEISCHKINIQSGRFKLSDAKRIAKEKMKVNRSDPHFFNRVVSGLMSGLLTPGDIEKSAADMSVD